MENIVICGGHLAPALAIIEKILNKKQYQIYYFGTKKALEGDNGQSLEYNTIKKLNIPFRTIITARLQRKITIYTLPSLFKLPIGIMQSFLLLLSIKPKVVISFGGYIALAVSFSAKLLQIPVLTHEQTHNLGLANKIISRFSQVLLLSFNDTKDIPKGIKTIVTGNPIRRSMFTQKNTKIVDFGDRKLPLIYITGGNLGSRVINETVGKIIPKLSFRFRLLHQCGNANNEKDFLYLLRIKDAISADLKNNYQLYQQIEPSFVGTIYKHASFVICRAGANTVSEIFAFGIPAILIPLPWAGQNEQEKNALMIKSVGLAEVIRQSELTPKLLLEKIEKVFKNNSLYRNNTVKGKKYIQLNAVDQIVNVIDKYAISDEKN